MATTNDTAEATTLRFELLQEEALQYEVDINETDDEGEERQLTEDELRPLVEEAKRKHFEEHAKEKQAAEAARASAKASPSARPTPSTPAASAGRKTGGKAAKPTLVVPARQRIPAANRELCAKLNLGEPTAEDYELADRHGYPVAVPGAKAYQTIISIHDTLGGGEREAGSVILLIDVHAANKLEYLIPL